MNTSFNQLSMPYLRAFVGLVLILLSLYATINFLSQGFTGLAFLGIVVFCLGIETVKILFSGDIGFYLALKMPEKALFSFCMVAILFCLSIGSETWFLMSGTLKGTAQLEQSTERTESLQAQIVAKQAQLAACNPSHLTKCVNPRTAELSALQSELDKAALADAQNSEALANQKFWAQIAAATATTPENLQLGINVMRSFLQELFGLYLFAQFSTWKRLQSLPHEAYSRNDSDFEMPVLQFNPDDLKAEIEHLKAELAKKQQAPRIESVKQSAMAMDKLKKD